MAVFILNIYASLENSDIVVVTRIVLLNHQKHHHYRPMVLEGD